MALYYDHFVYVDSRDVDGRASCRPSALLGHLQEAATLAAEMGGFGRDVLLRECGGFWMLARMWYRLERPLRWGEELRIRTWHRGGKGAMMYRDFDLFVGDEHVGESVSGWVLADMTSHKLLKLGEISVLKGTEGGELCKEKTLSKVRMPKEMLSAEPRRMRYSDVDINGHVNNTRYADFSCDALEMEKLEENLFVSEMQLGYIAECQAGEVLSMLIGGEGDSHFVKGVDQEGKTRFETKIVFRSVL